MAGDLQRIYRYIMLSQEDVFQVQDISNTNQLVGIERFVVAIKQKLLLYEIMKQAKLPKVEDGMGTKFSIGIEELLGSEGVLSMACLETSFITGKCKIISYIVSSMFVPQFSFLSRKILSAPLCLRPSQKT